MTPKKKALELIKVTFEPIANATNYKGVKNGDDKKFGQIENIAKNVAKKIVNEIIEERYNFRKKATNYNNNRIKFWQNVLVEIDGI